MSIRKDARDIATDIYTRALDGIFGLVERRVEWRRANAPLLALEAREMVTLLREAPGVVWFRKLRIKTWRNRWRKHQARARASNALLAEACGLEGPCQ